MNGVPLLLPLVVWGGALLLFAAAAATGRAAVFQPSALVLALLAGITVISPRADVAYLAAGASAALLAVLAWRRTRAGGVTLGGSALVTLGAAWALFEGTAGALPYGLSLAALAIRCGVLPLHPGLVALWRTAPVLQLHQFASLLALVFAHLRFVDHVPAAAAHAPWLVAVGATSALFFGLTALVRDSLSDFLQGSTLMHGGLAFAAVAAAGRGHHAAALFACFTMTLAVGGLGALVLSLEARVGAVTLGAIGGWARAFPRLAAAFAFLGAAGVGMPGTAGFIADDLLLHALWEESVTATVAVALASALLAIATLRVVAAVFFGPQRSSVAPDLLPLERGTAGAIIALLLLAGIAPMLLTAHAASLFSPI